MTVPILDHDSSQIPLIQYTFNIMPKSVVRCPVDGFWRRKAELCVCALARLAFRRRRKAIEGSLTLDLECSINALLDFANCIIPKGPSIA